MILERVLSNFIPEQSGSGIIVKCAEPVISESCQVGCVIFFCVNTSWLFPATLLSFGCFEILCKANCSNSFLGAGVRQTGLCLIGFSVLPFLRVTVTFAFFQSSGISPLLQHFVNYQECSWNDIRHEHSWVHPHQGPQTSVCPISLSISWPATFFPRSSLCQNLDFRDLRLLKASISR